MAVIIGTAMPPAVIETTTDFGYDLFVVVVFELGVVVALGA